MEKEEEEEVGIEVVAIARQEAVEEVTMDQGEAVEVSMEASTEVGIQEV